MSTLTELRLAIGVSLASLSKVAAAHPFLVLLGFLLFLVLPAFWGTRLARRRHDAAGRPWGAAWMSSALVVGVPLLALFLVDALLDAASLPSLQDRLLRYFSPELPGPQGPVRLNLVRLPAAATLGLMGTAASWLYTGLYSRGGLFVDTRGFEANGLMRLAGHWADRGAEQRFGLWAASLARAIFGVTLMTLPAAIAGHLPPVLWLAAAILTHGFLCAALHSLQPPAAEEKKAEEATAEERPRPEAAPVNVEDELARALGATAFVAHAQERAPAAAQLPEVPSADLFRQILEGLGAKTLYRHQARAIEAYFAGEHVLLFTPPASGRKVARDALAMHAVLSQGTSVLYLCRDEAEAEKAHALFRSRSENAHWRWNVPSLVLGGREGLDLDRVQPSIIFAGFADVHLRLLGDASRYRFFLRSLELVAVTHLETYQGPAADHLAHLLARLRRAVRDAAGASALLEPERPRPRLLLLAQPISPDVPKLAERVAASRVTMIGEELDGAPAAAVRHLWLTRADGSVPSAEEAAAALRGLGVPWTALGLEAELGARKERVDLRKVQAALVRADAASVAGLPLRLRHLGAESGAETALAFWMGAPDPLSRLLPGARGSGLSRRLLAPRLVAGGGSERVARDHARCALVESDWPRDELEAAFGAGPAKEAIALLRSGGQVCEESRCEIDAEDGEVRRRDFVRARKAQPHKEVTLGIVGRALAVEDRSTGQAIAHVPAERALAAAYPERVFLHGGRRYRVLAISEQQRREQGVLWAEVEPRAIKSVPVRRVELEMLLDRRRVHGEAPGGERRAPARRALAGREFALTWPRARIRERIEGFRNIQDGAVADAGLFPEIIDGAHDGRAAVLAFPAQAGWSVSPGALHALVHLFRAALPAVLTAGPDDLDVFDLEYGGDPAVAFVDLHPGGGGYAEAITLDAVRGLASLALAIVRGCSCRKVAGCPNCVRIPECKSGFGDLGARTPSRRDAERVLCELLDPALLGAGDAVRYEDEGTASAAG